MEANKDYAIVKWEYKQLIGIYNGMSAGIVNYFEDGKQVKGMSPFLRVVELGKEGWELVSVSLVNEAPGSNYKELWLKRKIF